MGIQWQDGGYSAEVEIYLLVNGRKLPVSHIDDKTLILREDEVVPDGHAQIIIRIDGQERTYDVIINAGESASELAYA